MFDITQIRATETGDIAIVDGEGNPLFDDGKPLSVTAYGPGSKVWQQADADRRRKRVARLEKNRGKASAVIDSALEDDIDFLVRVTISFNNWTYPAPDGGEWQAKDAMFRAAYTDDSIGFIRDHVHQQVHDWGFTKGSAQS